MNKEPIKEIRTKGFEELHLQMQNAVAVQKSITDALHQRVATLGGEFDVSEYTEGTELTAATEYSGALGAIMSELRELREIQNITEAIIKRLNGIV
jgi:DNA-binding ferritin-like protein